MAKRFIDTTLWSQNKWFRKLKPKEKLFWIYLICSCDSVGVWEEDFELASFIIGEQFTKEEINDVFNEKIKWFNGKKLWIIDFCNYQYGVLIEENIKNKPHQSYISLLKKHSLWIDYTMTIHSHKEKDKDKDKDKEGGSGEKTGRFDFKKSLILLGVSENIASDWMRVRKNKKASNTETAFNAIKNQIAISGLTPTDCIKKAVEKSWCGFEVEWIKKDLIPTYKPVKQFKDQI